MLCGAVNFRCEVIVTEMLVFPLYLVLSSADVNVRICPVSALREKRSTVVAQLKQLQSETEPIVKMFEDPETTRQMQSTRSNQLVKEMHPYPILCTVYIAVL